MARLDIVASRAGAAAKWRESAPPIPGPGLTVVTDLPALVSDALGDSASLEAVAELVACVPQVRAV